jgi:hypothetical protein
MHKLLVVSLFAILSVLAAACGSAGAPAEPVSSEPVNIKVETNPAPAMMGDMEVILNITDANGSPIQGAQVDVSADHTDMTGMTMGGAATEQDAGRYAINANFSMSGNWLLTVYVRKGDLDYKEDIQLTVQ